MDTFHKYNTEQKKAESKILHVYKVQNQAKFMVLEVMTVVTF